MEAAASSGGSGGGGEEKEDGGFEDPFFQHDITTVTAVSGNRCLCSRRAGARYMHCSV